MTKFTLIPKICKVLEIYYSCMVHNGYCTKRVIGKRIILGRYYIAEHSKTVGLNKGDAFIIKERYDKYNVK